MRTTTFGNLQLTCSLAVFAAITLGGSLAQAQVPTGPLNQYSSSETPEDDFHLSRASDFGHERIGAQLQLDYAVNPLVWEATLGDADTETVLIEHQFNATLGVSYGLWNRLVLFGGLPVVLSMGGLDAAEASQFGAAGADSTGLGDLYLGGRARLLGEASDWSALALQATLTTPTSQAGGEQHYRGDDHVAFHPEVLGELRPGLESRVILNLGARVRDEQSGAANQELLNQATFGIGFVVPVWAEGAKRRAEVDVGVQFYGTTAFSRFFEREQTSLEGLARVHLAHQSGLSFGLGLGPGLARGFGTPDVRGVLTVGYVYAPSEQTSEPQTATVAPPPCPPESCPGEVLDTDADGVIDTADRCVDVAEDADGFEDADGCPDADNDADGVADASDACTSEAGPAENRGCPDADRDGDRVVDRLDECPDRPGDSQRGCPEGPVALGAERIDITDQIQFADKSATILAASHEILLRVAKLLNDHPEIEKVRVEGHSDARGREYANVYVSQRRAEAVVTFLVEQGGVSAERLTAQGYGSERPLVANATTPEEHAKNRRVEFHIVRGAKQEQP